MRKPLVLFNENAVNVMSYSVIFLDMIQAVFLRDKLSQYSKNIRITDFDSINGIISGGGIVSPNNTMEFSIDGNNFFIIKHNGTEIVQAEVSQPSIENAVLALMRKAWKIA